jgi:hypothetical protein
LTQKKLPGQRPGEFFYNWSSLFTEEVWNMSSHEEWSRAMRAIWLLNTIEVELSHLGIPLMRVPPTLRDLDDTLRAMSEQDRLLVEDELSRAHASLAQVVDELRAGMSEIEWLLHRQANDAPAELQGAAEAITDTESTRSVVWQRL